VAAVVVAAAGAAIKEHTMPFSVGDWVVHPQHGVGQVVNLKMQQFGAEPARLYYEITVQRSTTWVLVDSPALIGLRPLTAKMDLARYGRVLKSAPAPVNKDHRQRQLEMTGHLKLGTFQAKCEVVRDLTAISWRKRLNEMDGALLRSARDGLCQEWAVVEGISIVQATQTVEALLREAKQAFQEPVA
jgi:CarD family transcriptional regulator